MPVKRLPNGRFEATVQFDIDEPKRFQYCNCAEARELVEAERIYQLLHRCGERARCTNGQIHAAADALLRAPCGQSAERLSWTFAISRWIRSRSEEARIYA
jgi:hypothetical protein